jgi:hypothetical protein
MGETSRKLSSHLAPQNIPSLNFLAGHMTNATGLSAGILLIHKDLLVKPTSLGNRVGGWPRKKGPLAPEKSLTWRQHVQPIGSTTR